MNYFLSEYFYCYCITFFVNYHALVQTIKTLPELCLLPISREPATMAFSTVLSIRLMNLIDKVVLLFGIKWLDYTVCHLTVVIVCSILYFLPNRTLCIEERQYTRQGWYIPTHIYVCIRLLLKMKVAQDLWWSKIFVVLGIAIFLETFHFK